MAGATSLLFAATLLPLPVPVVGATSHVCLTPVLSLLVGVRRIVWPTFFVLLLQAMFFAHGGITTIGVNTLTLGVLGPSVTAVLWAGMRRAGLANALGVGLASGLGGLSVYVADALVLAVALSDLASPAVTLGAVVLGFAPVQVPLAVLEAGASAAIVRVLAQRRPNLLRPELRTLGQAGSQKGLVATLLSLVLIGPHAEPPLFFERSQRLRNAAAALALTVVVLVANAGAEDPAVSLTCGAVGIALLLEAWQRSRRSRRSLQRVVVWTAFSLP